jgi:hypothetical protein
MIRVLLKLLLFNLYCIGVCDSPSHAIFVARKYCCPSSAIAILLCVCVIRKYCCPSSTIAILLCVCV